MGAKLGASGGPISDINVTPLIDVVLVLLVVFMVITPMLKSGKEVQLQPAGSAMKTADVSKYIVIALTADGRWYVEEEPVDKDTLVKVLERVGNERVEHMAKIGKTETVWFLIKGDRTLPYSSVREVMDLITNELRITTLKLATAKDS